MLLLCGFFFQLYAVELNDNSYSNTNKMTSALSSFDAGSYENSSFSKWSDTDTPFLPMQQNACMSPPEKNEEKIRSNLFENSYFYNYQLSQLMKNSKNGQNWTQAENKMTKSAVNQTNNGELVVGIKSILI